MAYNDVGKTATNKYRAKFDLIQIRLPQGDRKRIAELAEKNGESMNSFVARAIKEAVEKEENT